MTLVEMFRNLMVMAAADQKFTNEEIELLALRSNRWGISDKDFEAALRYAADPQAAITVPVNGEDRRKFLSSLIEVMAADGELAPVERRLFAEAAAQMGVSRAELDGLIDELL